MSIAPLITVGIDGSPEAGAAVVWAAEEAVRRGATLRIVYAWQPTASYLLATGDIIDAGRRAVADAVEAVAATGVDVEQRLVEGPAVAELVALSAGADLLVVASHGQGRLSEALLGSICMGCIRHADVPVLVVPMAMHVGDIPLSRAARPEPVR